MVVVFQFLSHVRLYDPMDCLLHARLPCLSPSPRFVQTHVHWVNDAIQPSHPVAPFSSCPQSFPASWSFPKILDYILNIIWSKDFQEGKSHDQIYIYKRFLWASDSDRKVSSLVPGSLPFSWKPSIPYNIISLQHSHHTCLAILYCLDGPEHPHFHKAPSAFLTCSSSWELPKKEGIWAYIVKDPSRYGSYA